MAVGISTSTGIQEVHDTKEGELMMSPRSCASNGSTATGLGSLSTDRGASYGSCSSGAPWEGDEDLKEVEECGMDDEPLAKPEDMAAIQAHLNAMNAASSELNTLQQERAECDARRRELVQMWAVSSARIAKCIGVERLAKVTPIHELRQQCKACRDAVEEASSAYARAVEHGESAEWLAELASGHVRSVAEFQDVQRRLEKAQHSSCMSPSKLATMEPYFEADAQHQEHMAQVDQALLKIETKLGAAKKRYHCAMQDLESLSESIRTQRIGAALESGEEAGRASTA